MTTKAQSKAMKKYMAKFEELRVRMTPEEKRRIEDAARAVNKSVAQYVKDCLLDSSATPQTDQEAATEYLEKLFDAKRRLVAWQEEKNRRAADAAGISFLDYYDLHKTEIKEEHETLLKKIMEEGLTLPELD